MDFAADPKFDNPRDVQIRLSAFDFDRLVAVGKRVRDLFPSDTEERIQQKVTDEVLKSLAQGVAGKLGGRTGVAPRIYLRKLVAGILDRVDMFEEFEPTRDFELVVEANEMTPEERLAAQGGKSPDDIELDL